MEDKIFYVSYCKAIKRYRQKVDNKELKQRRRRRLRKRPWKSEFTLPQSLPRLFYLV